MSARTIEDEDQDQEEAVTILNPDGTTSQRPMNFNPFDLEAGHIFRFRGGKLHEIEAMGFSVAAQFQERLE